MSTSLVPHGLVNITLNVPGFRLRDLTRKNFLNLSSLESSSALISMSSGEGAVPTTSRWSPPNDETPIRVTVPSVETVMRLGDATSLHGEVGPFKGSFFLIGNEITTESKAISGDFGFSASFLSVSSFDAVSLLPSTSAVASFYV
jgi:hypothetical protein